MIVNVRKKLGVLLISLATVSVAAQAAMMVIEDNESTAFIRGERYQLGESFSVESSEIDVAPKDQDRIGSQAAPAEITPENAKARTEISKDHWLYTAVLEEKTADSIPTGSFSVDLYVSGGGLNDKHMGSIYVTQGDGDSSAVEGARLTWDLGHEMPDNPLFVVKVHPYTPAGEMVSYTLESAYSTTKGYVWKGIGGEIDGKTNPGLTVPEGATAKITIRHGCGSQDNAPHNLVIQDSDGNTVAESDTVSECGDEATLSWTPSGTGEYDYHCAYHASSQNGSLTVESDGGNDQASFTLESAYSATEGYVWKGVGGEIDGKTNPDLTVSPGTEVTFTIRHGCGSQDTAPHNLAIEDEDGNQEAKSDNVGECDDETTLTWTAPDDEGDYSYFCQYHSSSQNGSLTVEAGDA